jgi:uncharacterized membrane protein
MDFFERLFIFHSGSMMSNTESPDKKDHPFPDAWDRNPYEAPTAHVGDVKTSIDDTLADEPNKVAAGRGIAWWKEGWGLFRESPGLWIGMGLTLAIISIVVGLIPVIGNLAGSLIFPVFTAGLMLGCHSLESGEDLSFGHLFAGFQYNFGRLVMIGLLYLLGIIVIIALFFVFGLGGGFFAVMTGAKAEMAMMAAVPAMLLGGLVALLLGIPLVMALWFSPALVVLHDLTAFEAMKLSIRGCLRNILPTLVYSLVLIALAVLATVPVMLGWLVLLPLMFCGTYAIYRDIFTRAR